MKNNLMKLRTSVFLAILIGCISPLTANNTEKYLQRVEREFDEAGSKEDKFKVVSRPVNKEALDSQLEGLEKDFQELLLREVSSDPFVFESEADGVRKKKFNWNKTNSLMLAISTGKVDKVRKFLTVVEDVNDPLLTAWGYRQPYSVAHMALDPKYPFISGVSLSARLAIINLLGEKGADFNKLLGFFATGIYNNPPLIVPELDGSHTIDETDKLRARALLFGADPLVLGSSGSLVTVNPSPDCPLDTFGYGAKRWCEIAFDDYLVLAQEGVKMKLADSVKERFKAIKAKRLKILMEVSF